MIDYDPLYANGILPYKVKSYIESDSMMPPISMQPIPQSSLQQNKDEFVPQKDKKISGWKKWLTLGVGAGLTLAILKKKGNLKLPAKIYTKYVEPTVNWTTQKSGKMFNKVKDYLKKKLIK